MTKKIKISIVGTGLMGLQHLKAIELSKNAKVHSIVDLKESTKTISSEKNLKWFKYLDEMLSSGSLPDGVIISTPNQMHEEHTIEIFKKIPVLLEKPIADSISSAKKIIKSAENNKTPLLIGYHRRYNPISQAAKQEIDKGKLGKIISVHANFWLYKPDKYYNEKWRTQKGAGPLGINLVHDIDLLSFLLGPIASVQAFKSNNYRKFDVEDSAVIILKFKSGTLGTINISDCIVSPWSYELTAGENQAYPETNESAYFIGGTDGSLQLPNTKFWFNKGTKSWWKPIYTKQIPTRKNHPLINQIEHFSKIIQKKEKPIVSGEDGLNSLKIFDAINKSSDSGKRIDIA